MTLSDFRQLAEARFERCLSLMCGPKNEEYSRNDDKLWNFKRAGQIGNMSAEQALKGMWLKHLTSIMDIIDDIDKGRLPDIETLDEKITDNINYLVLLEGLIAERVYEKQ